MPSIRVEVDLYEFEESDIVKHLEKKGYTCTKDGAVGVHDDDDPEASNAYPMDGFDLMRVKHLADCGQVSAARQEALLMLSNVIGRELH